MKKRLPGNVSSQVSLLLPEVGLSKRYIQFGAVLCSLAVLLIGFYWPFLIGEKAFFFKDTTDFFEPLCRFIGNGLANGRLPLWNPYNYCGMSQAAICSPSIFFPLNWLFAFLTFSRALAIVMLVSQLVCAAGMMLLVDSLGWNPVAGGIAALGVACGGYMFSLSTNYTLVATAAWMPAVIYCSRQCLRSPNCLWLGGNALSIFMLIAAGRPEISAPAMVLAVAASFLRFPVDHAHPGSDRVVEDNEAGSRSLLYRPTSKQTGMLVRSIVIGVLLSMPTILPFAEWVPWSRRAQGLSASEVLMYSAGWYDVLCMFVPQPLGSMQLRESPFAPLVGTVTRMPYYGTAYVSALLLAFGCIGIFKRGSRLCWLAVCALLLGFIVSLGENVPFMTNLVAVVPGASLMRFPNKLLFFPIFFLSMFAARGANMYAAGKVRLLPHICLWAIVACAFAVLYWSPDMMLPFGVQAQPDKAHQAQQIIGIQGLWQTLIVLGVLAILWLCSRARRNSQGLLLAAAVLLVMLGENAIGNCMLAARADYFDQPSFVLSSLNLNASKRPLPRITNLALARFTLPPAIRSADHLVSTVNNFQYARQMLRPFGNIDFGAPSAHGFEGAMVGEYFHFFVNAFFESSQADTMIGAGARQPQADADLLLYRLLQVCSTEYVINQVYYSVPGGLARVPPFDNRLFQTVLASQQANVRVWHLRQPLPRAYLASTWRSFQKRDDLLSYFVACRNNGFDPAKESLVEKDIGAPPAVTQSFEPVAIKEERPEVLSLQVNSADRRLLVLQDQYYPGWSVSIDGAPAELLRVNGFMRGVVVPPGNHKITFTFLPLAVVAGLVLASIGVVWFLLCWWMEKKGRTGNADG